MTREQQIRAALKLPAPSRHDRAKCQKDVENALDIMADVSSTIEIITTQRSMAASKVKATPAYHRALLKLRTVHRAVFGAKDAAIENAIAAIDGRAAPLLQLARLNTIGIEQTVAAKLAYGLLKQWGNKKITTTRGGPWHRLAAILYGDEDADLFQYLRALVRYFSDEK